MNNPLISVIIPTFNSDPKDTLKGLMSIANQCYKNYECIVVDDSLKKSSINFLYQFCNLNNKFHYIRGSQEGIAKALNQGISNSRGEFIARADDTDISKIDRLHLQVKFLQENKKIDVVGSNIDIEYNDRIIKRNYPELHSNIVNRFLISCPLAHPTVMIRREVFDGGNIYNETFECCEDLELWLRLYKNNYNFYNIQKPLVLYKGNLIPRPYKHYIYNTYARFKHFSKPFIFISAIISLIHFLLPPKLRYKIIKRYQSV